MNRIQALSCANDARLGLLLIVRRTMSNVIATQNLYLYKDSSPKVQIRLFRPEKSKGKLFECKIEIENFISSSISTDFAFGQNSITALLMAIGQVGSSISVLNETQFQHKLREDSSLLEVCAENCGLPIFDKSMARLLFPKFE